jgi:hypothetical protein
MQSEFVPPWQLFNSAQNSSQFYQPQGQQTMQRTAQVSQTMGPGFGGEAPQIQYLPSENSATNNEYNNYNIL